MIKLNYISVIIILLLFQLSCKNKDSNNQLPVEKGEYVSDKTFLKTYFSTSDIPYLLKEEKNSILSNKNKIINDKKFRDEFKRKARERQSGIRNLNYIPYENKKIPYLFKKYLLKDEFSDFDKDSITDFVILYELYKKRERIAIDLTNGYDIFTYDEIQKLIQGSFKDSIYYRELVFNRRKQDSITYWTTYNKRKDSLQSITYSIDSVLPFGPKLLGKLITDNKITYNKDALLDAKNIKARKAIFGTWLYFLELHPSADADLSENYIEKLMPKVKTYEHINLGLYIEADDQKINPQNMPFQTRISDLGKYEVYYSTTGTDFPFSCSNQGKKEEDCCYGEEFYCESTGYIILYDRKRQHSIIIPAFILQSAGQGYLLNIQFFYIENNTIYLFDGNNYGDSKWQSNKKLKKPPSELFYTHKLDIKNNGDIVVTEQCLPIDFKTESDSDEDIIKRKEILKKNLLNTERIRDSIFNKIKPVIPNYPFGPEILKTHKFPEKKFIKYTYNDSLNAHARLIDSILPFYKKVTIAYQSNIDKLPSKEEARFLRAFTLPTTSIIKKIELSPIDIWRQHYFKNLTNNNDCSNIRGMAIKDIVDFRLPNIKNYEIYFSTDTYLNGILTFYSPVTKQATIVNALDINDSYFRVFFINKDGQVEIYQGLTNNTSKNNKVYKISKTHVIEVFDNGEIKVEQQNNTQ